jgi:hypothetical protein
MSLHVRSALDPSRLGWNVAPDIIDPVSGHHACRRDVRASVLPGRWGFSSVRQGRGQSRGGLGGVPPGRRPAPAPAPAEGSAAARAAAAALILLPPPPSSLSFQARAYELNAPYMA